MLKVQLSHKNTSLINQSGQSAKSYFHSVNLTDFLLSWPGLSNKRFRLWFASLSQSNLVRYVFIYTIVVQVTLNHQAPKD
jgi:hypothetical protein